MVLAPAASNDPDSSYGGAEPGGEAEPGGGIDPDSIWAGKVRTFSKGPSARAAPCLKVSLEPTRSSSAPSDRRQWWTSASAHAGHSR